MKINKKFIVAIIVVLILLIIDQAFKIYCSINLREVEVNEGQAVSLIFEESYKGAFGVGQNSRMTYVISTVVVIGIILKFLINQIDRVNMGLVVFISFIMAGGISNVIDKLFRGFVVNNIKIFELPTVNLSFILILIGWIGLAAIFAFNTWKEMGKKNA